MSPKLSPDQTGTGSELFVRFEERFHQEARLFRAPGRVNLIGEHTDYNGGWVMPAAIRFSTWAAISPRTDSRVAIVSLNFDEEFEFSVDDAARPNGTWTDYVQGVAVALSQHGNPLRGANLMLWGDVPRGAGLSSSASVEVVTAIALLGVSGLHASPMEIARICQQAENEFVGARCGIMDQFIAVNGSPGHAVLLDCRSLEFETVPLPNDISIVIANSMVKHDLAVGEYNVRRAECEEGVRLLRTRFPAVDSLRDATLAMLDQLVLELPETIYRRCLHVITENLRVLKMKEAFVEGDLSEAGKLMHASHESLRSDFEVSCPELDTLVEIASSSPGVIGSRMTGGGFGGCTVSLVRNEFVGPFEAEIVDRYRSRTGTSPEVYVSSATGGATEVTSRA